MRKTERIQARSEDLRGLVELEAVGGELFILEPVIGSPGELRAVPVPVFRRVPAVTSTKKRKENPDDVPAAD